MSAARDNMMALAARISIGDAEDWSSQVREHMDALRAEVMGEAADLAEDAGAYLHRGYENEQSNGAMKVAEALRRVAQGPGDSDRT